MYNDDGETKGMIFFSSLIASAVLFFFLMITLSCYNVELRKNEELTERVKEQVEIIEYLKESEKCKDE